MISEKVTDLADKVNKLPESDKAIVKDIVHVLNKGGSELDQTIEAIRECQRDIEVTKGRIRTQAEIIREKIEARDEWLEVESLKEALTAARSKLSLSLAGDEDHNNRLEALGQDKDKLRSLHSIMSDHVVAYYGMTQERQVEMTEQGDARELVLTGKLGKEAKFQTSLFGAVGKKI